MKFQLDSPKLIQTLDDVISVVDISIPDEKDDVLNEVRIPRCVALDGTERAQLDCPKRK